MQHLWWKWSGIWQLILLRNRNAQGTVPCVDENKGWLTHPLTPNSYVTRDKSIEYTHGNNTASYSYSTTGTGENEKINADSVKYNNTAVLSSSYTYDDNGNVLTKSYGENNSIVNTYDSKDRITSTAYAGKIYNYT